MDAHRLYAWIHTVIMDTHRAYSWTHTSGGWWFLKRGRKDCALGCHWPACTVVWWHKNVRLKLFQGVLVNYKIAGRDNYVN